MVVLMIVWLLDWWACCVFRGISWRRLNFLACRRYPFQLSVFLQSPTLASELKDSWSLDQYVSRPFSRPIKDLLVFSGTLLDHGSSCVTWNYDRAMDATQ